MRLQRIVRVAFCLFAGAAPGVATRSEAQVLVLRGTVVPMSGPRFDGHVVIRDSLIVAVAHGPPPDSLAAAASASGVIYPGLIDTHNHPLYNVLPLWRAPGLYRNRYEWRGSAQYRSEVRGVYNRLNDTLNLAGEMGVWAKVRALAGGTVALQGWDLRKGAAMFDGDLARTVEGANFGRRFAGGTAIDIPGFLFGQPAKVDSLRRIEPWIIHLAEGRRGDEASQRQADSLLDAGLLSTRVRVIHGSALRRQQYGTLAAAGAPVIWSPISNALLYGTTTPVDSAAALGVTILLGSDWGPSGSKNLLGELKAAAAWNRAHGSPFSDSVLVAMVTVRPAHALGWPTGTIDPGNVADLVVIDSADADAYHNLIVATEENVRLVVVGGRALYGDTRVLQAVAGPGTEVVGTAGGREKSLVLPAAGSARPTLAETRSRLQAAFAHPAVASRSHLDSLFTASDSTYFNTLGDHAASVPWLGDIRRYYAPPAQAVAPGVAASCVAAPRGARDVRRRAAGPGCARGLRHGARRRAPATASRHRT
jgi:cytosine/adenosine deaminase-related metal-dependent hydrolase